jgi:hypothetical protein
MTRRGWLGTASVKPHITLVDGEWLAIWRGRQSGTRFLDDHVYFMTKTSVAAKKAREFCRDLNDGRAQRLRGTA